MSGVNDRLGPKTSWLDFRYIRHSPSDIEARAPHWFPVLIMATFAAVPWLRWRFSLRTLLIGMTVVAVLLGMAVMMLRGS